ncbi:MAG: helix-turn-helix domain-containing protein [Terriglobia bacterium]
MSKAEKIDIAKVIETLRERAGMSQTAFANALGVGQARVSQWGSARKAKRKAPSADALIRLAAMASDIGDFDSAMLFWREAGILDADLFLTARAVARREGKKTPRELELLAQEVEGSRRRPASPGELVVVPWHRGHLAATEPTGAGMAFPAELVPHPASTILLSFDESAWPRGAELPSGMFLLDTYTEGFENLEGLFKAGLGVMFRYWIRDEDAPVCCAVHVGTLGMQLNDRDLLDGMHDINVLLRLSPLASPRSPVSLGTYLDRDELREPVEGGRAGLYRGRLEIIRRAAAGVRLDKGFKIMGVVYGWLNEPPSEDAVSEPHAL